MAEEAVGDELVSDPAMEGPEAIEVENGDAVEDSHAKDGSDEEVEEAIKPLGLRDPGQPTQREIDEHELTHQPPRPWCDHCNKGRGQHDHHRAIVRDDPLEESAIPTISLDYCFLGDEQVRASRNPILVIYDNRSTMIGAWQTKEKGAIPWAVKEVADLISMIGYGHIRVTLKSDGESSIVALKKAIASRRTVPTT